MGNYPRKKVLTKVQFLSNIPGSATSISGIKYTNIKLIGNSITGIRESTSRSFTIDADSLYRAHTRSDVFNTSTLKSDIASRAQSPALAILFEMGIAKRN